MQAHFYRFPKRWTRFFGLHKRGYSVRIPSERHHNVRTVADLKAWQPGEPGRAGARHHVSNVEVCGWVRSVRKSSGVRFVDITDGSSMRPLQAVVDKTLAAEIRTGAAVCLKGTWHGGSRPEADKSQAQDLPQAAGAPAGNSVNEPPGGGGGHQAPATAELRVTSLEILGPSDPQTYPIQNKYQTPESLRAMPHFRPRTPLNSTMLRFRSDAIALLTQFFFQESFQQTHPPIITSSDCEGAGEAFTVKAAGAGEFFRDPKYLTVSTQLHLEALAQALGNVWTLSPTFRAEQSDTSRHLSEFYMVEAEMSFVQDMDQVMDLVQRMLSSVTRGLARLRAARELEENRLDAKDPAERLAFGDLVGRDELQRRWKGLMDDSRRWPRVTYGEAIEILQPAAHSGAFEHKPVWGAGLQSEHERYLAEKLGFDQASEAYLPVFVTHYPRDIKAFYMRASATPPAGKEQKQQQQQEKTVDCFDLLVPHLGELVGGSMREHNLTRLEDNMRLHGLEVPGERKAARPSGLGWYLDLRRWGCPPHGGFGLGFDRLLAYLTGVHNIRDVVAFPRHFERCDC